ncbi:adenylyltransferase/cytidyltransferase family protein [Pseudobutyrivibrio ruminis]|uniref:adenylyltransferase/cytidyltransferase family protein n=1 Tax=Pseudobutyrivibrio ruminis TaxID=46206 RepID=UPI00142F30B0|nr:adenylyltransferase/cytidyltransferase family protein [Pseudobutyrivibrio ruminis]
MKQLEKGILLWYPFKENSRILGINTPDSLNDIVYTGKPIGKYDYVVLYDALDKIEIAKDYLTEDGVLITIIDNLLGARFFCGESRREGLFQKSQIENILEQNGFNNNKFYSVFPNYKEPQLIFAAGTDIKESLECRYIPKYEDNKKIYISEGKLCDGFAQEGVLDVFANSYFIESTNGENIADVESVTLSLDRSCEKAMITILSKDRVIKKAANIEGIVALKQTYDNHSYLQKRNISVIPTELIGDMLTMPYIDYSLANNYLMNLLVTDAELFKKRFDEFYNVIIESSEVVDNNSLGPILKKGFIDLVPINSFWDGEKYIIFDQEYCIPCLPANVMVFRAIVIIYDGINENEALVSREYLYEKYNMSNCLNELSAISSSFINQLREKEIYEYNKKHQIFPQQINENYQRMFSKMNEDSHIDGIEEKIIDEYKKHCFDGIENKEIVVWGTGAWADKFMNFYRNDYKIISVIDNNGEKNGHSFYGVKVDSPESLKSPTYNFKVIVCVKNCLSIIKQLYDMGVSNIGVYDANYLYERTIPMRFSQENVKKKYKVGYVSGVFDLYHIGHINMFRRAKEQCEYLIVAVTSDEYVREHKKREPFIPVDERVECVKSCRYVDEVFITPYKYCGIDDAYRKFHYDVQFCGSDYANNSWWLDQKRWLEEHGSHLEFLSYTEQTSSTKIKELIQKGLL